jgi:predicted TPR repeat methyltransferase
MSFSVSRLFFLPTFGVKLPNEYRCAMQSRTESDRLAQERFAQTRSSEPNDRRFVDEHADRPDLLAQRAALLHQAGRTDEAITALHRAIILDPHCPDYPLSMGILHSERGQPREAATCFERALALDPVHAAAWLHLADSLMDLHEYDRAVAAYKHALTLRVPFPEAHNNLAAALLHLGDAHAAIAECRHALVERPGYALALNTLGAALGKVGLLEEAIATLRQAISLRPAYAKAYHNLGNILDQAGRLEEAKQAYHAAVTINPTLEEARYNLAALGDMPPPSCTPYPYLQRLFDSYASSFDQHLVETLDYLVPEKLYEAVLAARPGATALDVIDLGCGTGMVGQHFRGISGRLTGIDVSARMIQWAERRKVYDQLIEDDYVHYLSARQEPCDLVLAADVFIYAGDLIPVFHAAARLLRPVGMFAFSLEVAPQADYVLQPNRRYAHSLAYIQRLARETHFQELAVNPVKLRRQGADHAPGLIIMLGRNGARA